MWNRVDLAQSELNELRKLVGDEDNALVQRASCENYIAAIQILSNVVLTVYGCCSISFVFNVVRYGSPSHW